MNEIKKEQKYKIMSKETVNLLELIVAFLLYSYITQLIKIEIFNNVLMTTVNVHLSSIICYESIINWVGISLAYVLLIKKICKRMGKIINSIKVKQTRHYVNILGMVELIRQFINGINLTLFLFMNWMYRRINMVYTWIINIIQSGINVLLHRMNLINYEFNSDVISQVNPSFNEKTSTKNISYGIAVKQLNNNRELLLGGSGNSNKKQREISNYTQEELDLMNINNFTGYCNQVVMGMQVVNAKGIAKDVEFKFSRQISITDNLTKQCEYIAAVIDGYNYQIRDKKCPMVYRKNAKYNAETLLILFSQIKNKKIYHDGEINLNEATKMLEKILEVPETKVIGKMEHIMENDIVHNSMQLQADHEEQQKIDQLPVEEEKLVEKVVQSNIVLPKTDPIVDEEVDINTQIKLKQDEIMNYDSGLRVYHPQARKIIRKRKKAIKELAALITKRSKRLVVVDGLLLKQTAKSNEMKSARKRKCDNCGKLHSGKCLWVAERITCMICRRQHLGVCWYENKGHKGKPKAHARINSSSIYKKVERIREKIKSQEKKLFNIKRNERRLFDKINRLIDLTKRPNKQMKFIVKKIGLLRRHRDKLLSKISHLEFAIRKDRENIESWLNGRGKNKNFAKAPAKKMEKNEIKQKVVGNEARKAFAEHLVWKKKQLNDSQSYMGDKWM